MIRYGEPKYFMEAPNTIGRIEAVENSLVSTGDPQTAQHRGRVAVETNEATDFGMQSLLYPRLHYTSLPFNFVKASGPPGICNQFLSSYCSSPSMT